MVIMQNEMTAQKRERMRDGSGTIDLLHIVSADNLPEKSRLFSTMTLEKGCSVGRHTHSGETEIYWVLEGEGVLDDNGTIKPFKEGECSICGNGEYHAISNENETPLKVLAVIILD